MEACKLLGGGEGTGNTMRTRGTPSEKHPFPVQKPTIILSLFKM